MQTEPHRSTTVTTAPVPALSPAERRRRLTVGLLRSFAITVILVAAYYLLPLDRLSSVPMGLILGAWTAGIGRRCVLFR